mgnify:CR=1 FL=1
MKRLSQIFHNLYAYSKIIAIIGALFVFLLVLYLPAFGAESSEMPNPNNNANAQKKADFRVLVFSKTLGFRHSSITNGIATIRQLGAENGFTVDATEDSSAFTSANLARYQAVVFLSVTGDVLNEEQENAFREYVLGGGGLAVIHGALFGPSACEEKWAWYGEATCATFRNHSAIVPAMVDIEDRQNPSTAELPEHWNRTDEWYNYEVNPRGIARILATVDESTYRGGTMGSDHPVMWCKKVGKGRIWYTAMGHTESSFAEPLLQKHLLGGIQLVAGVKSAEFVPNRKPATANSPAMTSELVNQNEWVVSYRGLPLLTYAVGKLKPFVCSLHTVRGDNVLRNSPWDHKHHHGLMYGIKVNGINFWEEMTDGGIQKPVKTEMPMTTVNASGQPETRFTQIIHWLAPSDAGLPDTTPAALLIERRTLILTVNDATRETALHWKSEFTVGNKTNQVTLTGANYHGLGMRFLQSLDSVARHLNARGTPDLSGFKQDVSQHRWGSVFFDAPETPSTIVLFGHPSNVRGDAYFFTMARPFAYISATQNLDKEPLTYRSGEKFTLNYLITLYPERKTAEEINARARHWQDFPINK